MSFTPFQHLIAQVTLEAIADLGFALGGGQALHAHGYGDRLSLDLDFYVTKFDQDLFDRAEAGTLAALRERGYTAQVGHSDTWLRQILVTDPGTGEQVVLSQPGWTPARLFTALRDNLRPVITAREFAADLAAAGDQDPEDYHAYGLTDADITCLAADFTRWAAELRTQDIDNPDEQFGDHR